MITRNFRMALSLMSLTAAGFVAHDANAGSITNTVTEINVIVGGTTFVRFAANISGRPACATTANEFAFDSATDSGRAMLSLLQAAQLSGKRVIASGTNSCTINGTRENLNSARILAT